PDGRQIAAIYVLGSIDLIPSDGGQAREVFHPAVPEPNTGPLRNALTWTPDQRYLLYVRPGQGLSKVSATGGEPEKVNNTGAKSLTLHPDGRRLVFSANVQRNRRGIWTLENVLPTSPAKK